MQTIITRYKLSIFNFFSAKKSTHRKKHLKLIQSCFDATWRTNIVISVFQALHQRILDNNFGIVRCKDLVWRRQDSERFYAEHSGRFFYQRLVEFMSSGPMRAYILAREDAISHWRELMGPTKVFRARFNSPASIRGQFGLTDTRNTTHGSDSLESAQREITFFFPDFCADEWMKKEEPLFRSGQIRYDHQNQIHTLSLSS
uniref:Nucleoside diphosphate kinase n=1 Tax=Pundamilia nyererei TaxID=303518 RepID=A0A3B4FKF7_9CICH